MGGLTCFCGHAFCVCEGVCVWRALVLWGLFFVSSITWLGLRHEGIGSYLCFLWRLGDLSRGVHAFWFPPRFLDARLLWALSLFKDWGYFGCLSLSFSFFSSVSIIQFATISMVRVVMDIFYQSECIEAFYWFFALFLLKSGTRAGFLYLRACAPRSCAGVNIYIYISSR